MPTNFQPPVNVSPLIRFGRYSMLVAGLSYGAFWQSRYTKKELGLKDIKAKEKLARDEQLAREKALNSADEGFIMVPDNIEEEPETVKTNKEELSSEVNEESEIGANKIGDESKNNVFITEKGQNIDSDAMISERALEGLMSPQSEIQETAIESILKDISNFEVLQSSITNQIPSDEVSLATESSIFYKTVIDSNGSSSPEVKDKSWIDGYLSPVRSNFEFALNQYSIWLKSMLNSIKTEMMDLSKNENTEVSNMNKRELTTYSEDNDFLLDEEFTFCRPIKFIWSDTYSYDPLSRVRNIIPEEILKNINSNGIWGMEQFFNLRKEKDDMTMQDDKFSLTTEEKILETFTENSSSESTYNKYSDDFIFWFGGV